MRWLLKLKDLIWGNLKLIKIGAVAFAIGFVAGGVLGWYERGVHEEADRVGQLEDSIDKHAGQETASQNAGRGAERAKQNANEKMDAVVHSGGSSVFDANGLREQAELIAAGEGALNRQY